MNDMENRQAEEREETRVIPAVEKTAPTPPRRRRADRYRETGPGAAGTYGTDGETPMGTEAAEHPGRDSAGFAGTGAASFAGPEGGPAERDAGEEMPEFRNESETAREVARRFQMEERNGSGTRMPGRSATSRAGMAALGRGASPRPVTTGFGGGPEENSSRGRNRERIGYAPGQMGSLDRGRMSAASRARLAEENRGEAQTGAENRYDQRTRMEGGNEDRPGNRSYGAGTGRYTTDPRTTEKKKGRLPAILTAILLVIGAALIILLVTPEDAEGPLGMVRRAIIKKQETVSQVLAFSAEGGDNAAAPAQVRFTIGLDKNAAGVRLIDEKGEEIPAVAEDEATGPRSIWILDWYVEDAWEGLAALQIRTGDEWTDTGRTVNIHILAETPATAAPTSTETLILRTAEPTATPEPPKEETGSPDAKEDEEGDAESEGLNEDGNGSAPEADVEAWETEDPEAGDGDGGETLENAEAWDSGNREDGDAPADGGDPEDGEDGWPEDGDAPDGTEPEDGEDGWLEGGDAQDGEAPENGSAEQGDPESVKAAENADEGGIGERPIYTVTAAESADPSIITSAQIYNGTKKVSEYARAEAERIQMPTLGEYTRQQMGILTFRTDAFRQNAAIGTVDGMSSLELAWTAEAGSVKGSSGTMYYGIGWTGQPAIVKWSKEVREQSDLYDSKKEKTGLKEVIVAGLDGRIYFLDLSDGTATRNSIKLGYPMKGTPSLSPSGAPYMTVGQFARKMARGTGTIGLRQYNLYSMKEMSLIDGLDAKNNRPYNSIGSFETSALIDRKTSTMVTAGTNGMLYVIRLNPEFDYSAGVYQQSPTQVVLRTRAKGEKDADTAVEASVAMYDHYVYYADMGGILRCVDTNSMTTAWAVSLGDAVESTPALDWHGTDGLDLYAATELSSRKRGEAEVSCIDALSGEERWKTGIGVEKDSKGKTVSGFRASPVIGQNGLSEYVYYTVNNLSDAGRETLNLSGTVNAAVFAMRKADGSIVWSYGLSGRGYSSPVAVYDSDGNGAIIQCAGDGSIVMLDGLNGRETASLQIDGAVEASPAVYNNILVIGTTEKNKNNIYGIRIQ